MPAPASAMAGAPERAPASNGAPKEDRLAPGAAGSSAAVRRTPRTPITPAEAGQQRPDLSSGSTTSTQGDEAGEREARSRTRGGAWQRGGQRPLTCHRAPQPCCGRRCCAARWAEQACACQAPTPAAKPAASLEGLSLPWVVTWTAFPFRTAQDCGCATTDLKHDVPCAVGLPWRSKRAGRVSIAAARCWTELAVAATAQAAAGRRPL